MAESKGMTLSLQQSLAVYGALQVETDIVELVKQLASEDDKWQPWIRKTHEAYDRLNAVYNEFRNPSAPPKP